MTWHAQGYTDLAKPNDQVAKMSKGTQPTFSPKEATVPLSCDVGLITQSSGRVAPAVSPLTRDRRGRRWQSSPNIKAAKPTIS